MLFWIILVALGVLAAWMLVLPTLKAQPVVDESRQALNVKIFNQRLAELDSDKDSGQVDEEEYQALKLELERNFLNDMAHIESQGGGGGSQSRWVMLALVLIVPISTLVIYKTTGYKDVLPEWMQIQANVDPLVDRMLKGNLKPEDLKSVPMSDFVYGLQRRAQFDHEEAQLWFVLGSTYLQLQVGNPNEQARLMDSGTKALRRAYYLEAGNTEYALSYAQVLINQNNGLLDLESRKIINALLEQQPELASAIMMLSMASYQGGDYQIAIDGWQKLLSLGRGKAGHDQAEAILKRSIAQAKVQLAQENKQSHDNASEENQLKVIVDLAESVEADLNVGFLMVYAQAEQGPPMPLAIKKISLPTQFPAQFVLSDADAMMAAMTISQFDTVKLTARISKSGQAMKAAGDWFGLAEGVKTKKNDDEHHILIEHQVP